MKRTLYCWLFLLFVSTLVFGQGNKNYEVLTVAFYNVENLFDTLNDPNTKDDARTPEGRDRWTEDIYALKVKNTAKVLAEIGRETTNQPPAVIGLCEVENRQVIIDVLNNPLLKPYNYGIVHIDSPDERGIDVALIYQKKHFLPISFKNHALRLFDKDGTRDYTRDQLLVYGMLEKEPVYILVHHWPSRSGGQKRSEPNRIDAAALNKKLVDSVLQQNPKAKIINMGDFNDEPTNTSVADVLQTTDKKRKALKNNLLYTPMMAFYKQGIGTYCYRGNWNVLDQIHVSGGLLKDKKNGWKFWKAGIYNKPYLINKEGRYKGYPFRSFAGGRFLGGYSDHFAVYAYLIREVR